MAGKKYPKKTILYINPYCRPGVGGAETLMDEITDYVREQGNFVYILTYQPITGPQKGEPIEKAKNLEIRRYQWFGTSLFIKFTKMHPIFNFMYLFPYIFLRSFIFMARNRQKIDIVDSHGFVASLAAKILKVVFRKKTIMTIVAFYGFQEGSMFAKAVKWVLGSADKIIVESPQSKDELAGIGVPRKKMVPFVEWVDLKRFKPENKQKLKKKLKMPSNFLVLFVGRAIKVKGVDIMIDVAKKTSEIDFVFISTAGDLIDVLEKAGKEHQNITFINGVDYKKLHEYYAMADLFVVPSRMEDAPRTGVEAIACGTPTIGSNVGGIPSVINDKNGVLAEPNEVDFRRKIFAFYKNRKKLEKITKNCRKYALKHFSSDNAEVFIQIYDS